MARLFVHILNLIGFRNRLVVLVQWAWRYFTDQRSVRLITGVNRKLRLAAIRRTLLALAAVAAAFFLLILPASEVVFDRSLSAFAGDVTLLTNRIPVALLDLAVATCIVVAAVLFVRSIEMVSNT